MRNSTTKHIEWFEQLSVCRIQCIVQMEASTSPPPGRHLTFLKIIVQIPPYPSQNAVQMPHTRFHSGDQMPPPRGHFTGTWMTEGRKKPLQLSNKIFINTANNSHSLLIIKTEKHCRRIYYEQNSRAKRRKPRLQGHWMFSFSSCVMQHSKRSIKKIPPTEITTFHTCDIRDHFTDMHHCSHY